MDVKSMLDTVNNSTADVEEWVENEYQKTFAQYFEKNRKLYEDLKTTLITDSDLEWILISLPLELFTVSEKLGQLQTRQEAVKMHIRDAEFSYMNDPVNSELGVTARKEQAIQFTSADRLYVSICGTLIERVTREISFSRELIMSAKKIWDARRSAESAVPITKSEPDLPEYNFMGRSNYIG